MPELLGIATVFVLGIGAQWIAWRFHVPSILLLLILGFLAGPVTGYLHPGLFEGPWLFPIVSVAVGIILFEGGLSLRIAELKEVGRMVLNLITIGVGVTWIGASAAAYVLLGYNLEVSLVVGAILTVTGPTVIVPLLRHIRPQGRVGAVAKWEGITIDPIGAILAVLVLETVLFLNEPASPATDGGVISQAAWDAAKGLALQAFIGVGVGTAGALFVIFMLRKRLVPDYLHNPVTLMAVVAVFAAADLMQHESGLVATTLMGIVIANQTYVPVRRIIDFKEDLRVLLIAFLFIILSARLDLAAVEHMGVGTFLFLGALMLLVRPAAVLLSSLGTRLSWKERGFMAWLAPRGIVAAAVASLFSFRLQPVYPEAAETLVPVIFFVIVGTVAIYGLTITPLARWLGLAQPNPQGVLFVGGHDWARQVAARLYEHEYEVLVVDSNPRNVWQARREGLPAQQANVLSEGVMDRLNLGGIGRMVALTTNDEVNALAVLNFLEIFESAEVYQLASKDEERKKEGELPQHLRGRPLFGDDTTFASLSERFSQGAVIEEIAYVEGADGPELERPLPQPSTPLFLMRDTRRLFIFAEEDNAPSPEQGDLLVVLVDPPGAPVHAAT